MSSRSSTRRARSSTRAPPSERDARLRAAASSSAPARSTSSIPVDQVGALEGFASTLELLRLPGPCRCSCGCATPTDRGSTTEIIGTNHLDAPRARGHGPQHPRRLGEHAHRGRAARQRGALPPDRRARPRRHLRRRRRRQHHVRQPRARRPARHDRERDARRLAVRLHRRGRPRRRPQSRIGGDGRRGARRAGPPPRDA